MKISRIYRNLRQSIVLAAVSLALSIATAASTAWADRVPAEKLLPRQTLAVLHITSVPQLVEAFKQTNIGRMVADPQIQPFVSGWIETATSALSAVKDATGLTVEEIATIPQGEITVALVPTSESPAFVAIIDCGDNIANARKLAVKIQEDLEKQGRAKQEETIEGFTITFYPGRTPGDTFVSMERENAMVICNSVEVAKQVLTKWTSGHEESLEQNKRFNTIMGRCRGAKDEAPQIMFYADPIAMASEFTKGNPGAQMAMAMMPMLGLDGFKGVGGSLVLATEDFDSIFHLHVLFGAPRSGVLDLVAFSAGDDVPPQWVPADITAYTSIHWDFDQTYWKGLKLGDTFQGEGNTAKMVNDRAKQMLGVDVENDLLPALTGRVLIMQWFEHPPKLTTGGQSLYAIQVRDGTIFDGTFKKIIANFGDRLEKKSFSGMTYYKSTFTPTGPDDASPTPCVALFNDWVFISDRETILQHIVSHRDDADKLAAALDYKVIANKIGRQPGGEKPGWLGFNRTEDSWKYMYDLAASEQTRDAMQQRANNNGFFKTVNDGLQKNPLPKWEVFSKYLSPSGTMVVEDDSGVHFMQFSLKRQ